MRLQRILGVALLMVCVCALDIPLQVEQPPVITAQSPVSLIAFPFDESFPLTCDARGQPEPRFRWTKNGQEFEPLLDPRLVTQEDSGTFVIPNNGNLTEYQGTYRCYAWNRIGTAMTREIQFIVPNVPKFPKETLAPVEVEEGQPFTLRCDPPAGIPPLQIYWMTINLQHIEQDQRVSMGLNGDLYFSHAEEKDSRRDYCCFAAFPRIRTIVQKTAMSVVVQTKKSVSGPETANAILDRRPALLTPSGVKSEKLLVKGDDLKLECIAEGYPTPQVEWVLMGHRLPSKAKLENHGKLLVVPEAEQEDSGKYICKARNTLGEAVHYFSVTVEEPPDWLSEPQSQLSMIGANVLIKCSASGTPQPTVTWRVNGVSLQEAPAANRKVLQDTIILHNAKASDSAVYQCEASNRHGTLLANANILIMNLPPLMLTAGGRSYWAVEGLSVTLLCEVFSSPPSAVSWSRAEAPGSLEGPRFTVRPDGSLQIAGVQPGDAGSYTCVAKNTEGSAAVDAALYVKDPTRISEAPEDQRVLRGSAAQFSCLAEHDRTFSADFQLRWEKDGVEISLNDTETSRFVLEDGLLQILNVSHRDQGVYTCVARSPVDQDSASALLLVLDVPDAPENLVLSEHRTRSVKLKWIPGDDHNSSTTEFVLEFEEARLEPGVWKELLRVPGNQDWAAVRLHGHLDYRFRVSGVNAVGRGPASRSTQRHKTPATAPDRNPGNIKIEGRLPDEMDIKWEPLAPIEHNGPGLEYKVSYRRQDLQEDWEEHMVKRHAFLVKDTPTFVPYEIKIQARNHQGWAPEPEVVIGYSGEDFPSAAPDDVAVDVLNSSAVKVTWRRVDKDRIQGHLGGYRISWWRLRGLLDSKKVPGSRQTQVFPGDRVQAGVSGLKPFSEYGLIVMTFNGRGNGPGSHPVTFRTPEGVPERNPVFRVSEVQRHTAALSWTPPAEPNGVLTGYLLEYQQVNDTEGAEPLQTLELIRPDASRWILRDLEPLSRYRFYLSSCTAAGCGPAVTVETTTTLETGVSGAHGGISTHSWFIGLMAAIALLTLSVLITCFINRNRGGKYSVKEKEDLHPDVESQGINDDTFCEYSDDEKPLKGSRRSLSRDIRAGDSGDSLVDYGDEDVQFNEDGSFIGEYAGRREKRASAEIKGGAQTPA